MEALHPIGLSSVAFNCEGTGSRLRILIEIGIAWTGSMSMRKLSMFISSPNKMLKYKPMNQ